MALISGSQTVTTANLTDLVDGGASALHSHDIAADSIVEAKLDVSNGPTNGQFLQAQSGEGGGLTWAAAGVTDISCRLTDSANSQTAANNAQTPVTWDTETFDTDSMHNPSSNPSRITFTTAGKYIVSGSITFANTNATGARGAHIRLNGSTRIGSHNMQPDSTNDHHKITVTTGVYEFDATDYVELTGEVGDAGAAIAMYTNTPMWFSAVRVGQ
jgi:hypothetical protein